MFLSVNELATNTESFAQVQTGSKTRKKQMNTWQLGNTYYSQEWKCANHVTYTAAIIVSRQVVNLEVKNKHRDFAHALFCLGMLLGLNTCQMIGNNY